jgi:hypothetical protein
MDCRTFQKNLEDYLEGGLDFPRRFGMERHAQQCFGCGNAVTAAQKLSQMARQLHRVSAPRNFEAALLSRIQQQHLSRRSWKFWHWPACFYEWPSWRSIALSAAVVSFLGFGIAITVRWVQSERAGTAAVAIEKPGPAPPHRQNVELPSPSPGRTAMSGAEPQLPTVASDAVKLPARGSQANYANEEVRPPFLMESADSDYVEYLVPGPGDRQLVMRLPKTIRMRYGQPSEDYFIRNVSH